MASCFLVAARRAYAGNVWSRKLGQRRLVEHLLPEERVVDTGTANSTTVERASDCELVVARAFEGPARRVFEAWSTSGLLTQWWVPKSCGISFISCDADVRTGGSYRFVFGHPAAEQPMAFFGRYIDVAPDARIVWTNDEGGEGGSVTTVTFEERGAQTLVVLRDLYPSKAGLDDAIASGSTSAYGEMFEQLDDLLVTT
jgi:uncharacterized protein YndB with AHSA1/START domain